MNNRILPWPRFVADIERVNRCHVESLVPRKARALKHRIEPWPIELRRVDIEHSLLIPVVEDIDTEETDPEYDYRFTLKPEDDPNYVQSRFLRDRPKKKPSEKSRAPPCGSAGGAGK